MLELLSLVMINGSDLAGLIQDIVDYLEIFMDKCVVAFNLLLCDCYALQMWFLSVDDDNASVDIPAAYFLLHFGGRHALD